MNREKAKRFLPISKHFADGGHIQRRLTDGTWIDTDDFLPDSKAQYRKKPVPLECWVNINIHENMILFPARDEAELQAIATDRRVAVHMREVKE